MAVHGALIKYLQTLKPDDVVLPFFDKVAPLCARLIKSTAVKKDWPSNVKFVGFHNIRHGVIATVRRLLNDEEARVQAGHSKVRQAVGATHNYARANHERGTKVREDAAEEEGSDEDTESEYSIEEEDAEDFAKEAVAFNRYPDTIYYPYEMPPELTRTKF